MGAGSWVCTIFEWMMLKIDCVAHGLDRHRQGKGLDELEGMNGKSMSRQSSSINSSLALGGLILDHHSERWVGSLGIRHIFMVVKISNPPPSHLHQSEFSLKILIICIFLFPQDRSPRPEGSRQPMSEIKIHELKSRLHQLT